MAKGISVFDIPNSTKIHLRAKYSLASVIEFWPSTSKLFEVCKKQKKKKISANFETTLKSLETLGDLVIDNLRFTFHCEFSLLYQQFLYVFFPLFSALPSG